MQQEIWKAIPGIDPYEASSLGRVRRPARIQMKVVTKGMPPKPHKKPTKILKPYQAKCGHLRIELCIDSVRSKHWVHSLVAAAFHGPRPDGMICRHLNGIPNDNVPDNLAWGTHSENQLDRHIHGTASIGKKHHRCKLDENSVRDIKQHISSGFLSHRQIAAIYGVTNGAISAIKRGDTWSYVSRPRSS